MTLDNSGESYNHYFCNHNNPNTLKKVRTYKDINIIPFSTKYTLYNQFSADIASKYNFEATNEVTHHCKEFF